MSGGEEGGAEDTELLLIQVQRDGHRFVARVCGTIVSKAELKSRKSSLNYEALFSRCVRAWWIAVEICCGPVLPVGVLVAVC